ncbi:MAG: hypothetical protein V7K88_30630 [Nostoc sp.]|uniref:hypothetical protein n=1 Tax=Nostoc sp. TaxID=1180 RepID=UPI002FF46142
MTPDSCCEAASGHGEEEEVQGAVLAGGKNSPLFSLLPAPLPLVQLMPNRDRLLTNFPKYDHPLD